MDMSAIEEVGNIDSQYAVEGLDFITSGDQYLTFTLGQEHYGVDILCVREIRGWEPPTMVPNSADYVKGVVNLRGTIVPILDLRMRFQVGQVSYLPTTVVIVLKNPDANCNRTMGFVVDAVSDVLNADQSEIKKAPSFPGNVPSHYIEGLVNAGSNLVTLLKLESLQMLDNPKGENCGR